MALKEWDYPIADSTETVKIKDENGSPILIRFTNISDQQKRKCLMVLENWDKKLPYSYFVN